MLVKPNSNSSGVRITERTHSAECRFNIRKISLQEQSPITCKVTSTRASSDWLYGAAARLSVSIWEIAVSQLRLLLSRHCMQFLSCPKIVARHFWKMALLQMGLELGTASQPIVKSHACCYIVRSRRMGIFQYYAVLHQAPAT